MVGVWRITESVLFVLGVDSLFKKINCDKSAISDMLGGVAGVTEGNMMQVRQAWLTIQQ
jgi:hypothetical protein